MCDHLKIELFTTEKELLRKDIFSPGTIVPFSSWKCVTCNEPFVPKARLVEALQEIMRLKNEARRNTSETGR